MKGSQDRVVERRQRNKVKRQQKCISPSVAGLHQVSINANSRPNSQTKEWSGAQELIALNKFP